MRRGRIRQRRHGRRHRQEREQARLEELDRLRRLSEPRAKRATAELNAWHTAQGLATYSAALRDRIVRDPRLRRGHQQGSYASNAGTLYWSIVDLERVMDGYTAVMDLAADPERAQKWLPVVVSAYRQARRAAPYGGRFAGAWVLSDLGGWVPSLRPLAAAGIVEKSGDTVRGGKRAYYSMPDADGVQRALLELGLLGAQRYRGVADFVNAYAGTLDPELALVVRRGQPPSFGWDVFAGDDHLATVVLLEGETHELLHSRLPELRRPSAA